MLSHQFKPSFLTEQKNLFVKSIYQIPQEIPNKLGILVYEILTAIVERHAKL